MSYEFVCTNATKKALTDDVIGMADEMGVSDKFLYALLKGEKRDIYHEFREKYFKPVARRNQERAQSWLSDLQQCLLKYGNQRAREASESLAEQIGECGALWLALITARDRQEPVEHQHALLSEWIAKAQSAATTMEREIHKQKLNAA